MKVSDLLDRLLILLYVFVLPLLFIAGLIQSVYNHDVEKVIFAVILLLYHGIVLYLLYIFYKLETENNELKNVKP